MCFSISYFSAEAPRHTTITTSHSPSVYRVIKAVAFFFLYQTTNICAASDQQETPDSSDSDIFWITKQLESFPQSYSQLSDPVSSTIQKTDCHLMHSFFLYDRCESLKNQLSDLYLKKQKNALPHTPFHDLPMQISRQYGLAQEQSELHNQRGVESLKEYPMLEKIILRTFAQADKWKNYLEFLKENYRFFIPGRERGDREISQSKNHQLHASSM